MFCKYCSEDGGNGKFCVNCGAKLEIDMPVVEEKKPVEKVDDVVYTQTSEGIDDPSNPFYGEEKVNQYGEVVQNGTDGMAIASLILGILGLLSCCISCCTYPLSITGLALGVASYRKGGKGLALAGIICSGIALLLAILDSIGGAITSSHMINRGYDETEGIVRQILNKIDLGDLDVAEFLEKFGIK